jgi:hypothetical protein
MLMTAWLDMSDRVQTTYRKLASSRDIGACRNPLGFVDRLRRGNPPPSTKKGDRRAVPSNPDRPKTAAELLAAWRAAGRDSVAARAAAGVAELALKAAAAAEEAATEVEAAAEAAVEAVQRARAAATRARAAALQAAEASSLALESARGDKVRANHDVEEADVAESGARDAFHEAEGEAFAKGD